jgi:hypothetical protein
LGRWDLVGGTVKIGGKDGRREGFGPREKGFSVFFRVGRHAFGEGGPAGRADQWKHLVDSGQKGGRAQ